MSALSLLKKQTWMCDDSEYLNIVAKIGRVAELTRKRKDHEYVKEFLGEWEAIFAYGTYAGEGEVDPSFSASETWSLMRKLTDEGLDTKTKTFRRQVVNFMRALRHSQRITRQLAPDDIKTLHKLMMYGEKHKDGKDVLIGEFRKTRVFAGWYHEFAPASAVGGLVADALNRYYSAESDDPVLNAVKLFIDLINIHPFEDGNGRLCRLVISHVLIESGMSLFPVLLSSFHRRGRRHYIQAVKRFREKPSALYTMVCKSLVNVWENFEQNLALLEKSEIATFVEMT